MNILWRDKIGRYHRDGYYPDIGVVEEKFKVNPLERKHKHLELMHSHWEISNAKTIL